LLKLQSCFLHITLKISSMKDGAAMEERKNQKALFQNIDCVSMYVDDLDEGLRFYRDGLGLTLLWRADGSLGLGLPNGVAEVVLCTGKNPMVDFKVESVAQDLPTFIEAGGTVEYGPFDIDIGKCAVVLDPWGNRFCILDMTKGTYDTNAEGNVIGVSLR